MEGVALMPEKGRSAEVSKSPVMEGIEVLISRLLLGGVLVSMATVLVGVVLMFVHHPEYLQAAADLAHLTQPGAAFPHTLSELAGGVAAGRGQAVVALGLLLLIATPILRVAVSVVGFALERDRAYTVICGLVLVLLVISFLLGKASGA